MPPWYLQNSRNWVIFSHVEENILKNKKIKTRPSQEKKKVPLGAEKRKFFPFGAPKEVFFPLVPQRKKNLLMGGRTGIFFHYFFEFYMYDSYSQCFLAASQRLANSRNQPFHVAMCPCLPVLCNMYRIFHYDCTWPSWAWPACNSNIQIFWTHNTL